MRHTFGGLFWCVERGGLSCSCRCRCWSSATGRPPISATRWASSTASVELTYRAFAERTHRLANALVGLGVEPGDRVSFITYNTHQLLEAYYGVLEAGAVLNPINIRLAPHEIAYILEHAALAGRRSSTTTSCRSWSARGPAARRGRASSSSRASRAAWRAHEYEALLAAGSAEPLTPEIDENAHGRALLHERDDRPAEGRRADPSRAASPRLYAQLGLGFTEDDVVLHVVPLFHVNGWGVPHFLTMIGGRHVMLRRFEPGALMEHVQRHRVTRLLAVPAIFNAVLNHRERAKYDLSSLRQLIIGGSPASPALVASARGAARRARRSSATA